MLIKSTLIWIIVIVCLAGCKSDKIATIETGTRQTQARNDTPDYFRDLDLKALDSGEVWENKYGPGLKLTTTHYEIFTMLLEPLILRHIPRFIESAYEAYNNQLPEHIESKTKFTIYLFADRPQWEDFTGTFAGEQAEIFRRIKAGAYYHNGACVAYDIGYERTLSVLAHEGWHQFNGRHFKFRLPSWLDEGTAMLFESYGTKNGTIYFEPGENSYRLDALKKTLTKNKMMPLKDLIATNPGDVLATDQTESVMAFYSQSYALVRFLCEAGYNKQPDIYHRMLTDGLRGNWPLDEAGKKIATDRNIPRDIQWNHIVGLVLFKEYIGSDFDRIDKEYLAFCRQITAK